MNKPSICAKCKYHEHISDQRDQRDDHYCNFDIIHEIDYVTGYSKRSYAKDCYTKNRMGTCEDFEQK